MTSIIPNLTSITRIYSISQTSTLSQEVDQIVIALVPNEINEFIRLSKKISTSSCSFVLGDNSFPYIEIAKIPKEEQNSFTEVIHRLKQLKINLFPKPLTFNKLESIRIKKFNWLYLYPNNPRYCMSIREQVLNIFKHTPPSTFQDAEPVPGMPIARLSDHAYAEMVIRQTQFNYQCTCSFICGYRDEIGQLTKIIEEL